jgi:arylsulfotransferase ASST
MVFLIFRVVFVKTSARGASMRGIVRIEPRVAAGILRDVVRWPLSALAVLVLLAAGYARDSKSAEAPPLSQHFRSRLDLKPPIVRVRTRAPGITPGYIFVAPKLRVAQAGPMILDDKGQVVWFKPINAKDVTDFRAQRYHDRPVLTWWRGRAPMGVGGGFYSIYDSSYHKIGDVRAGNGLVGDLHEFRITPRDTALFTIYRRRPQNLAAVGGPKEGKIFDGIVQEIDIATGRVLFEWHSFPQVGLKESYAKAPPAKEGKKAPPLDYFHINSIDIEPNGNLLVSARNTHTIYEIDPRTKKILWRLGGKRSDFKLGPGVRFAWQHDARRQSDGTITLFDNSATPPVAKFSRVLVLRVDEQAKKATLLRSYHHPKRLLTPYEGNAQFLPNGHVFVGWGANPYFTEFDARGHVLLDASIGRQGAPPGKEADTYRAYRFDWTGETSGSPAIAVRSGKIYVSWNGATKVARWEVLAGPDPKQLGSIRTVARNGFETAIPFRSKAAYVAVQALGREGRVLGRSKALKR